MLAKSRRMTSKHSDSTFESFGASAADGHEVVTLELTLGDGPRYPIFVARLWAIRPLDSGCA
jgi:hypothetical protein